MCDVCCKEFKGWCKSFTKTEVILSVLEGALLLLFVGFLAFLILHLLVCNESSINLPIDPITSQPDVDIIFQTSTKANTGPRQYKKCTWTPSRKTKATTRYFEIGLSYKTTRQGTVKKIEQINDPSETIPLEESEGKVPEAEYKSVVLALVKTMPRRELVLGCVLSIVSEYWTLTAASCIEAIEEVDSLDSFVIMESHSQLANGVSHAVVDVQINPFYQGTNESYDLAALKSDASLLKRNGKPVLLPKMLDYLLITTGERLTILGYGEYRTVSKNISGRSLREVHVHAVPSAQCARKGEEWWAPRHLWSGAAVGAGAGAACAAAAMCAGGLDARAAPCYYCAGTPLLAGRVLLGVMSGNTQCGLTCHPALYVNVAAVRDWLDFVIESN